MRGSLPTSLCSSHPAAAARATQTHVQASRAQARLTSSSLSKPGTARRRKPRRAQRDACTCAKNAEAAVGFRVGECARKSRGLLAIVSGGRAEADVVRVTWFVVRVTCYVALAAGPPFPAYHLSLFFDHGIVAHVAPLHVPSRHAHCGDLTRTRLQTSHVRLRCLETASTSR